MLYAVLTVSAYLLHALQSLLQEAELLLAGGVLLAALGLCFTLLLFQKLHLIPVGIQLTPQTVVLFFQSLHLSQRPWETTEREREREGVGEIWKMTIALATGKGNKQTETHERRRQGWKPIKEQKEKRRILRVVCGVISHGGGGAEAWKGWNERRKQRSSKAA